jgi:hypothetical protein
MRIPWLLAGAAVLAACNDGGDEDCAAADEHEVFVDADGDGFGTSESAGMACEAGSGQADDPGDCDDANAAAHPGGLEECDGIDTDCDLQLDNGFTTTDYYPDLDQDTFGDDSAALDACVQPPGYVADGTDCDDTNPLVNPSRAEICNGDVPLDDDCDGFTDDEDVGIVEDTQSDWYPDLDMDGFGKNGPFQPACSAPSSTSVDNHDDCNDANADQNPDAPEVCDGVDNNCDLLLDDADPTVDPAGFVDLFADLDGDGAGDLDAPLKACGPHEGISSVNSDDCNDGDALIAPDRPEATCDTIDNDCDELTPDNPDLDLDGFLRCDDDCNDNSANVFPGQVETVSDGIDANCNAMEACFQDVDGDMARTDVGVEGLDFQCSTPPSAPPAWPIDCDDNDVTITWSGDWELDDDFDTFGNGVIGLTQCADPGAGYVLPGGELDCDDADGDRFPGAEDACNDGVDSDCDTLDTCRTCQEWLVSDPSSISTTYAIRGNGGQDRYVWCDMDTDGGGWTLVGSSAGQPLNDVAGSYHMDLADTDVFAQHTEIWDGLRTIADFGDVRFACKLLAADTTFAVDLSFYDVDWYGVVTSGTDAQSCFNEDGGVYPTPARRDNLAGVLLSEANAYDAGPLVGENACGDQGDFALDFDDGGIDSNNDGTDWGVDDNKQKCTEEGLGEAWFLYARE